ncbi:CcoQ/FixQ family Cbb3-type cytochrome c oxidase assembly chaperone [Vitiosangium sp. GDMCC 1.1324]|uniref:CcoQ/FixQ family Cbb3-type cytochrome c oxidase assembly chaperone n=1 Tax=Vitiosangium sp. (strain GDMCC 1.1324) TaxID=2138576 RepID=UPI000D3BA221|nr:CcoQ/FixQ family Cbb3-type cytochrome c oxidase assembly chaperone [Vitiosangium sp. GDMCC 1.1324]PTL77568.1 CcoQ/FixQ family Cbb3-type cytochrome c oxidase assembly chaperone [Vitiosangium sp. GDMCC 1.1324]
MWRQFYQGMDLVHLPLFTLLLFFAVFLGVTAWVLFVRRGQDYDALARLPLAEPGAVISDSRGARTDHELE